MNYQISAEFHTTDEVFVEKLLKILSEYTDIATRLNKINMGSEHRATYTVEKSNNDEQGKLVL